MATLGLSKVFILDKYFIELQKYWETEKKLQDASSSNEAVHLQQRLKTLSSELVTLQNRLHVQGETLEKPSYNVNSLPAVAFNYKADMRTQLVSIPPTLPKNQIPIPPIIPSVKSSTSDIPVNNNGKQTACDFANICEAVDTIAIGEDCHGYQQQMVANNFNNVNNGNIEDLIHLPGPLTEDAVLRCIQARFLANKNFTKIGPILLSLNPFNDSKNSLTLDSMQAVKLDSKLLGVVDDAVKQQSETGYPQAIILSGISGCGKSYASMLLLRHLFDMTGGGPATDAFKHLAAAFTVLRSLGSAKTASNCESSRIGHFIEVQVTDGALYRTKIHCYFLDQSRVVRPLPNEKNYHIFYQMLSGLTHDERVKLNLEGYSLRSFNYLKFGDTKQDEAINTARFLAWKHCLGVLGIPFTDVVRVLAAILLLGNVQFLDGKASMMNQMCDSAYKSSMVSEVTVNNERELNMAANLLGIPASALFRGITSRTHNARSQIITSYSDANMSNMIRDALAKALYCRTVATIVRRANSLKRLGSTLGTLSSDSNESVHNQADVASQHCSTIRTGGSKSSKLMAILNNAVRHATDGSIGILDMFGFEDAKPSYLEQLCINLCAETMQHFYNTHIFKSSIESCRDECIHCDIQIDYVDNVPCIDLISSLKSGLLNMLEQECSVRGSADTYVTRVKSQHRHNARIVESKPSDTRHFTIQHFAGPVTYDASDFLHANRDVIPDDVVCVFHKNTCSFGFATHLFGSELKALHSVDDNCRVVAPRGISFRISPTSYSDLLNGDEPVSTLTQDFHTRLDNLLRSLVHAKPHFIRCIKANDTETPNHFDRFCVMKQIRSLQVLETVNLMAGGYPHRTRFKVFNARYRLLASFGKVRFVEERAMDDCHIILQSIEQNFINKRQKSEVSMSWAFGKRHVFLSEGMRQELEAMRNEKRNKAAVTIQSAWRCWRVRRHWPTLKSTINFHNSAKTRNGIGMSDLSNHDVLSGFSNINMTRGGPYGGFVDPAKPNSGNCFAPKGIVGNCNNSAFSRPRPQPISGTPPLDITEKYEAAINKTSSFFGLDLERPPPVPPSRSYVVYGNKKIGYPHTRIVKSTFVSEEFCNPIDSPLMKGDTVLVVGTSNKRGHLVVECGNRQMVHVPFQYLELNIPFSV